MAQARSWLPDPIGGVLWFGVDDTYSTVYFPMYCGVTDVPHNFAVGTGSFHEFTWDSAFWVFNWVSNYAYLRYSDMIQDIQVVQRELEGKFLADQPEIDAAALALLRAVAAPGQGLPDRLHRRPAQRWWPALAEARRVPALQVPRRQREGRARAR